MDDESKKRLAILGGGSWGTALAILWARHGHRVDLWVRTAQAAQTYRDQGCNTRYLPDFPFPAGLRVCEELDTVLAENDLILMAVPLQAYRSFLQQIKGQLGNHHELILLSKGIELDRHLLPTQIVADVLGDSFAKRALTLSGPSFAAEVARDLPTTVVLASQNADQVTSLQHQLNCPSFRMYRNEDVLGVELCGAMKNVVAIAAGMVTGMGFGLNTLAALITRGLAEITRLGVAMGAQRETFAGLAGMGDLVLTCNGKLSRNLRVGLALSEGHSLQTILHELGMVAEGVHTARAAVQLAQEMGVELPISQVVYRILHKGLTPKDGLRALMSRGLKSEKDT